MNKIRAFIKEKSFLLFSLLVLITSFLLQLFLLGKNVSQKILITNSLDFSWGVDSIERLSHGYIAGRDFIFTYGPLYQLVYGWPSLLFHFPSYISILISPLVIFPGVILLLFYLTRSVITNKKSALLVVSILLFFGNLLAFPDTNTLLRTLIPMCYGVFVWQYITDKNSSYKKMFFVTLLPGLLGLYIFDLFLTCIITLVLIRLYYFFSQTKKNPKNNIVKLVSELCGIIIFEICFSYLLSGGLSYLRYSLDTVQNYQYILSIPFSITSNFILLCIPLIMTVSFVFLRKNTSDKKIRQLLTVIFITVIVGLRAGFIRSDDGHVLSAVYPSLIASFLFLFMILRQKIISVFIIFLFFLYCLIPYKIDYVETFSLQSIKGVAHLLSKNMSFFDIYELPKNYYYTKSDFTFFNELISQNKENVMIYPYDTYLLPINHTTYNTLGLQFYQYSHSLVEKESVLRLQNHPPKFIILGVDTKGAVMLDDIPNFSRNPDIAKWMLTNYTVYKKQPRYLVLTHTTKKTISQDTSSECPVFDIDTSQIMKANLFENIGKPSTFYLDSKDSYSRLPYSRSNNEMFVISNSTNTNSLADLFMKNWDFSTYKLQKRSDLKIIKKYPFPKLTKVFTSEKTVKCYN